MLTPEMMDVSQSNNGAGKDAFTLLFEHHPMPMWVYDHETLAFLAVNQSAILSYGYTKEEFLSFTIKDIRPSENTDQLLEKLAEERPLRQHIPDWRHTLKDGTIIDVEITSHTIDYDNRPAVLVMARDITERKRVEEQLRHQVGLLKEINDAIISTDLTYRIQSWNKAAERIYGWSAEEALGKKMSEVTETQYLDTDRDTVQEKFLQAGHWQGEVVQTHQDGRKFYILSSVTLVYDQSGAPVGVVAVNRDITERKKIEMRSQLTDELLELTGIMAKVGGWEFDVATGEGTWTAEVARIHDLDPDKPTNVELGLSFYPPEALEKITRAIQEAIELAKPYDLELEMITHMGNHKWVRTMGLPIVEDGKVVRIRGIFQDITEAREREKEQDRINELLQLTGRMAKVGGWEIEVNAFKGTWTDEVARIHDLDPNDPADVSRTRDFYSPESQEKMDQAIRALIIDGRSYELELELVTAQGNHKWVKTEGHPVKKAGRVVKIRGTTQDITQQKQLETENEQLTAQYYQAQKMESIGRLAGGIAHDFNNLITAFQMYGDLLNAKMDDDNPLIRYVNQIRLSSKRAKALTQQILAFSRQQMLDIQAQSLNQIVEGLEPMLRRLLRENIEVQTKLSPDLPAILGDKGQLEQVLLNLIVNAGDAMPDGGSLFIGTELAFLDESYTSRYQEVRTGMHALITVSDTGHGMDADTRVRIFDPFFTTKPQGEGTGLGMATVFGIVKQHKGDIHVYSEVGHGTTFKIYFPITDQTPVSEETINQELSQLTGTETILLVEDEDSLRKLMSEVLRGQGYHVLEMGDPTEALALAAEQAETFHLLLTDVIMPKINGRELYETLASQHSQLKVLYMSGYTHDIIAYHDIVKEDMAFLQKPFTVQTLLKNVRRILDVNGHDQAAEA